MEGSAGAIIASLTESAAEESGVLSRRPSAGTYHSGDGRSGGASQASVRALNERAVEVINRVSSKLKGQDFAGSGELEVHEQVQRLIEDATSVEHLCQCYLGWCPFW